MAIKLLVLETHQRKLRNGKWSTSGVDYARLIVPATYLAKLPEFEVEIRKEPFTKDEKNWNEVTSAWDIIWTSYIDEPVGYVQLAFWAEKNNCKLVIDVDDNLFELDRTNPVYEAYHAGTEKMHIVASILEHVPKITTTTQILQRKLNRMTKRDFNDIKVLPNYIDINRYNKVKSFKPKNKITLLHAGSSTHYKDLMEGNFSEALVKVLKENPDVEFVTIGNWIPQLQSRLGFQYRQIAGKPDVYEWIDEMWEKVVEMTDIVLVPLKNDEHTKCKSEIKFLEFSSAKVVGVYQKMDQYERFIKYTENGFLAETKEEWYKAITKLIKDAKLREMMGNEAYSAVLKNNTIEKNIKLHAEYFTSLLK